MHVCRASQQCYGSFDAGHVQELGSMQHLDIDAFTLFSLLPLKSFGILIE